MGTLSGKIVEASTAKDLKEIKNVGPALKNLRLLSGLTQNDMASRLNIQQAAISKIEKGGDTHLSTIKKYVEALGASLEINAAFHSDAPLALSIRDNLATDFNNDKQLILPLLEGDTITPNRDIVLSIRPKYSEKILEGLKTVELRRRFPVSAPKGMTAYIYSTTPTRAMVGSVSIRDVLKLPVEELWDKFHKNAYINKSDFDTYFTGVDYGFVLVFDAIQSFSRPIPLDELRKRFKFQPPQSFLYAKHDLRKALKSECTVISN